MCDPDYVCSLDDSSVKKAKKELHEDPDERPGAVAALRDWVAREPWITAPPDSKFLLAFLRCGKFSQLKARERLGYFMELHKIYPQLAGIDPGDEKILNVLRKGSTYVILPRRDKEGRTVLFARYDKADFSGKSFSSDEYITATMPLLHSLLLCDEHAQVNGLVVFADCGAFSIQMLYFFGMDTVKKQKEHGNKSFPIRAKSLIYYNTGPVFETMMTIFKPFIPEKIRKRMKVFGQKLTAVYKEIDMSLLPDEYLPDDYEGPSAGSWEQILEHNIKEYLLNPARREFLKELYSGKYHSDTCQRDKLDEQQASFRKLNVS